MIARREEPHPGAQLTFTDIDGHRFQVFVTDLPDTDIAYLEALYRGRGRAERQICDTKDTGLTNLPSHSFQINHAWLQLVLIRPRPAGLVPPPRPRRPDLADRRTETAPLLLVPHRRPTHRTGRQTTCRLCRQLALDPRPRHRLQPRSPTPAALLNKPPRPAGPAAPYRTGQPTPPTDSDLARPSPTRPATNARPRPRRSTPQRPGHYRTAWASGAPASPTRSAIPRSGHQLERARGVDPTVGNPSERRSAPHVVDRRHRPGRGAMAPSSPHPPRPAPSTAPTSPPKPSEKRLRHQLGDQRFIALTHRGRLLPPHDVVQHTLAVLNDN